MNNSIFRAVIEGRGGQGVLTLGQLIGLSLVDRFQYVSVSPSYTAEMFGGPCYCYVTASDDATHNPIPEQVELAVDLHGTPGEVMTKTIYENTKIFSAKTGRLNSLITTSRAGDLSVELLKIRKNSTVPLNIYMYYALTSRLGLNRELQIKTITQYFAGKDISHYLTLMDELAVEL